MEKYLSANAVISKFCNAYGALKKELPIRPSEMGVLNIIVKRPGKFTPLALAELLEVSKPMVTAHIRVLEKKGYVKKEYSREDKRSFFVTPTKAARELVAVSAKTMDAYLEKMEHALGQEEFSALLTMLERANRALKEREE